MEKQMDDSEALCQMTTRLALLRIQEHIQLLTEPLINAPVDNESKVRLLTNIQTATAEYLTALRERSVLSDFSLGRATLSIAASLKRDHALVTLRVKNYGSEESIIETEQTRVLKTRRGRKFRLTPFTPRRVARAAVRRLVDICAYEVNVQPVQPLNHINVTVTTTRIEDEA